MSSTLNLNQETIDLLKTRISPSEWQKLEEHLNEEMRFDSLRKSLMAKLEQSQQKMEQDFEEMSFQQKSTTVDEMQHILYDLQLVEHASKKHSLNIAKIIFSANPNRCTQRETSPVKLKPPKRRKNELYGLANSNLNEEFNNGGNNNNNGMKRQSARETKLYLVQQQEERLTAAELEELALGPSSSSSSMGNARKGARGKRKAKVIAMSTTPAMSPTGEKEDDQQQGEQQALEDDDKASLNLMLKSPSPPAAEDCPLPFVGSPNPISMSHGTRTRKRGREPTGSSTETASISGARSPRKRAAERQLLFSSIGDDILEEQIEDCDEADPAPSVDEPTYCLCERVSFGDMICCDYEFCSVEWFHFQCVNIKNKPKGKKWFCPLCRHNEKPNLLKPELQQKLEQNRKAQGQ